MHRSLPVALGTLMLGTALVSAAAATPAQAQQATGQHKVPTRFAYSSDGYGTQVKGGSVPANSDQTAFNVIGCTNVAGKHQSNYIADATVPGLGKVHGVRTDLYTQKSGDTYASYSTHSIARLTLAQSALGSVDIRGIASTSRAYNQAGTYKAATTTKVASITFTPTGGKPQALTVPDPGQTLTIPGLATIRLGLSIKRATTSYAQADAVALVVTAIPLHTVARVARTHAQIGGGIKHAVFGGYAAGAKATAADDNLRVGRVPLAPLPCEGTRGKIDTNRTAAVTAGDGLSLSGLVGATLGINQAHTAKGVARGQVANASLGNGALQVKGVVAQVTAIRHPGGQVTTSNAGTEVGSVVANGQEYSLKRTQTLNIPGVAKLQSGLTTKLKGGLQVIGLRVTLLDGTGAVVDLGVAKVTTRKGIS